MPGEDSGKSILRQIAANQGNADAMCNLGVHYYFGRGAPQDSKRACEWFVKAAKVGNEQAQRVVRVEPVDNSKGSAPTTDKSITAMGSELVLPDFVPPESMPPSD